MFWLRCIVLYYFTILNEVRKLPLGRHRVKLILVRKVWIELTNTRNNPVAGIIKEQLSLISRMIVWDDQNQSDIFEYVQY